MSVSAIWTTFCDRCAFWENDAMGDTKAEAVRRAKALGWRISRDETLCNRCAAGRCICTGSQYFTDAENATRRPNPVHPDCRVHSAAAHLDPKENPNG